MKKKLKYMFQDPRNDIWRYKRQYKDGTWFNFSLGTEDQGLAEQRWPMYNRKFEREADKKALLAKYKGSKEARREKFWQAAARFLMAEKKANGGRLPPPLSIKLPTYMEPMSHPFIHVRDKFLEWAAEHDPDAAVVFELGDMKRQPLFEVGIVGAYFTLLEMERLENQ